MTDQNERPTISERYGVAIGDGSTRIAARGSSGDVVLAAALQRNRLGALLLRLQSEYDSVRGDLEHAGQIKARAVDKGKELLARADALEASAEAAAEEFSAPEAAAYLRQARALRAEAASLAEKRTPAEIMSARAFILIGLKTLRETKQRVGALALTMAAKPGRGVRAEAAVKLAGRVLDVYLDPTCAQCDGTGKVGNRYAGEVEKDCSACRGSGHRRDILGNGPHETTFAAVLFGELQRQAAAAAGGMARMLGPEQQHQADAEADAELQQRLAELRSAQAQED
jgi:hypothetical protein